MPQTAPLAVYEKVHVPGAYAVRHFVYAGEDVLEFQPDGRRLQGVSVQVGHGIAHVEPIAGVGQVAVDAHLFFHQGDGISLEELDAYPLEAFLFVITENALRRFTGGQNSLVGAQHHQHLHFAGPGPLHGTHDEAVLGRRQHANLYAHEARLQKFSEGVPREGLVAHDLIYLFCYVEERIPYLVRLFGQIFPSLFNLGVFQVFYLSDQIRILFKEVVELPDEVPVGGGLKGFREADHRLHSPSSKVVDPAKSVLVVFEGASHEGFFPHGAFDAVFDHVVLQICDLLVSETRKAGLQHGDDTWNVEAPDHYVQHGKHVPYDGIVQHVPAAVGEHVQAILLEDPPNDGPSHVLVI